MRQSLNFSLPMGFPVNASGKNKTNKQKTACQCKRRGLDSLSQEDTLEEGMQPTPVFLLEESYGQRSLMGYSPWGHKDKIKAT